MSTHKGGLCIGFISMLPFVEFSDHVEIWNPGQRREGTSSSYLYFIYTQSYNKGSTEITIALSQQKVEIAFIIIFMNIWGKE